MVWYSFARVSMQRIHGPWFPFSQPESFLVLPADARQHRQLSVTKQRDQRDRIGSATREPKELSDRLWTTLGMNQQKLPRHLLPPKTAKLQALMEIRAREDQPLADSISRWRYRPVAACQASKL